MARRAGVVPFTLAAGNAEGGQGPPRKSPSRTQATAPPQGAHSREVAPKPTPVLQGRSQPILGQAPGAGNAQRRDVFIKSAPPPPALAPAPTPPPPPPPPGPALGPIKAEYSEQPFGPVAGPGLAPIYTESRHRSLDQLPGIAELTTGVSPYGHSGGGQLMGSGHLTPGSHAGVPVSNLPAYPFPEPARHKRRASPEPEAREASHKRRMG